jgi:hypothetical protein
VPGVVILELAFAVPVPQRHRQKTKARHHGLDITIARCRERDAQQENL